MGGAPKGGPSSWDPEWWEGPNFRFFPSPATFFILSSLSWESSRGILVVCLMRGDTQMSTLGVLGLS